MSTRPELAEQIAAAQDRMLEHLNATRGHRRARFVANARARPRRGNRVAWLAAAGALAAACVVAVIVWATRTEPDSPAPSDAVATAPSEPPPSQRIDGDETLDLHGGGTLAVGGDGSATVVRAAQTRTHVVLRRGQLGLSATGQAKEGVDVEAGPFHVSSDDSRAEIRWDPTTQVLDVRVSEGEVLVRSAVRSTHRVVVAGEAVEFSKLEHAAGPTLEAPAEIEIEIDDAEPDAPTRPRAPSKWRKLAAAGKHAAALEAAVGEGFSRVLRQASADDLLTLARAARYAKDAKRARQALKAVRRRFSGTGAASRAAYGLGRVAFDFDRDYRGAAQHFQTYLRERPKGSLAREALGRLVESQRRSGAKTAAKETARRYLERYPSGPHADIARRAL